jgi:hypothetical protein
MEIRRLSKVRTKDSLKLDQLFSPLSKQSFRIRYLAVKTIKDETMEYTMKQWRWTIGLTGIVLGLGLIGCEQVKVSGNSGDATDESQETTQDENSDGGPTVGATNGGAQGSGEDRLARLSGVAVPSEGEADSLIQNDGQKGGGVVYVTLNHLAGGEGGAGGLEVYRFGVTKALNSISTKPTINKLEPLDPGESVYRLRLDQFSLNDNNLRSILTAPGAKEGAKKVGDSIVVKGDWLVYAVTRPEVYDRIMRIPNSVGALESQLKLGGKQISGEVGDRQSDVTFGRRTLIRMDSNVGGEPGGYYWRSVDYFGPLVAGEFFFSLPNGLQGYMLSGFATQHRIDAQPFVATDKARPQDGIGRCVGNASQCGYVINGESCMTCHENGVNMNKNMTNFKGGTKEEFEAAVNKDSQRFMNAIAKMGFDSVGTEPIKKTLETFRARTGMTDKRPGGSEVNPVTPGGGIFAR